MERNREAGGEGEVSACPVSSKTLTIMWCLGAKREKRGER